MIWAKRRFKFAEFAPYQERLGELALADRAHSQQYMMVSTETGIRNVSDYYVGLPDTASLPLFDGFEVLKENDLPGEIDNIVFVADASSDEFLSRFELRSSDLNGDRSEPAP